MDIQKEVEKIFGESEILVLDRKPRDTSCALRTYQELVIVISKGKASLEVEDNFSGNDAVPMRRWNVSAR